MPDAAKVDFHEKAADEAAVNMRRKKAKNLKNGSFASNESGTPNGMTTPSMGSVSSYSSSGSNGKASTSSGSKLKQRPKKKMTKEEREMFLRIEREWREEDAWLQQEPGMVSTIIWTPILIGLRCLNIWLTVVSFPFSLFMKVVFGVKMKKVRFWDVPLERRKQTIAVLGFVMLLPMVMFCYFWSLILLIFPLTTFPMAMYFIYIWFIDKSHETGKRTPWLRYMKFWRHFANYFPIRLIKTTNLDPSRKYVFSYHPHGVISLGALGCFGTDALGFSRRFPGLDLRLLTLELNFYCPWIREILLSLGICSASRRSCNQILSKGPGSSIMLVVGGAAESLDSQPGTYRLTLGRKGFVRVALDNGADLVPVLAFGENDVFDTMYMPKGSWGRSLQEKVRKSLGFATPLFWGRGIFNYSVGILPHRRPIIVVVGKPIKLPKIPDHLKGSALSTTPEGIALVDQYHELYIQGLREIWQQYKERWAVHRQGSLVVDQSGSKKKSVASFPTPSRAPPGQ